MSDDIRPYNCRFRLQDEGKPYPKSGCQNRGKTIMTGLGNTCSRVAHPGSPAMTDAIEPSNFEQAEWSDVTYAYVKSLRAALDRAEADKAAAVEAERERCAGIADAREAACSRLNWREGAMQSSLIAAAIRAGAKP